MCINDETPAVKAVATYKFVLEATKEVFGEENMTVEVMKQAIDAATYISYRVALEGIPPLKMPPVTMKKLDI